MQSARSLIRRASRRMRRSRSTSEQERSADLAVENDTLQQVVQAKLESGSSSQTPDADAAGSTASCGELKSDLIVAAAKLSDLDSSTEDVASSNSKPADYVDQLFIKQRREVLSELQTIQDSHRPVTKGDQRRLLERFLRQHLHGDVSDSISDEGSNEDGSPVHRQRRNGMVLMELEGLWQQQSVTQRLRCTRFRQDLENMVRGVVCRQEREVQTALRLGSMGLPGNRHAGPLVAADGGAGVETASQVSGISSVSSHSSRSTASSWARGQQAGHVPMPPPPPPVGPANWRQHQHQAPQPPPALQPQLQQPVPQPRIHGLPPPPPRPQHQQQQQQQQQQHQGNNEWPAPAAPWLVQNSTGNSSAPNVMQQHREAIITEISELVHRQLVQETLESDFRGRLEFLMGNRLDSIGADGERVMNYIHSIPQSQHIRRNDFSHLGIQVRTPEQEAEAAMGASGGTVPAAVMHEMTSLRSQMNMLQEMVRMSMEMQLDLQRAIRQEVSAALNHQNGTAASASSTPPAQPAAEGNCIICLDKEVDAVLYQCGHMCVCLTCGLRLASMGSHCPMCRAPIRDVIRAYRTSQPN